MRRNITVRLTNAEARALIMAIAELAEGLEDSDPQMSRALQRAENKIRAARAKV